MIADDDFTGPGGGRTPGDFERNSQGRPWVIAPNGKRKLYSRPSSYWPFDDYGGVDPIYANRGTFLHALTEAIDKEASR